MSRPPVSEKVSSQSFHLVLNDMSRNYTSSRTSGGPAARAINDPGEGRSPSKRESVDPIDSLTIRSRKRSREDFSFKSCFASFCHKLYNFTIASCQYSFCYLCYRKRRSYQNLDSFENEPDGSTEGIRAEIEGMKSELKFHFMNPFQKWKYDKRRRFPWKLITHMIVIILATIQLWFCALERIELKKFAFNNRDTFIDLFIIPPIASDKCDPLNYYGKASAGTIRRIEDLWTQVNHTINTYYSIKTIAIGPYQYGSEDDLSTPPPPLVLDLILFDPDNSTTGILIKDKDVNIHELLYDNGVSRNVTNIKSMTFKFNLSSLYTDQNFYLCALFPIEIELQNSVIDGTMPVYLRAEAETNPCKQIKEGDQKRLNYGSSGQHDSVLFAVLGSLVLLFIILSTIQCIRSLLTSARFTKRVKNFFLKHFNYSLTLSEYLPLYNGWFMGIIFSNILVAVGTVMFLFTAFIYKDAIFELNDVSSIIFGMGVFFQWLGLLRFLSYFDKYNILLITLRLAIPSVIRFMVCGFIFYVAFLLLGWLVLGPYHPKFADPSVTSECLYSLINGDDMFNTYIQMDSSSLSAFIFSKIYLYVFISLFIYVVLSVFISLISDTYETLHEVWTVRSRGFLQDFANDCLIETTDEGQTASQTNVDNDFEVLSASNRGSTENSPLLHRPVTYLGRSGQFRTTPTVHLHPSANSPLGQRVTASYSVNNSSPEMERASSLYPRLTESRNHV